MCMGCSNASPSCAKLRFEAMPVIKVYADGTRAVKCSGHGPAQAAPAKRCISCGAVVLGQLDEGLGLPCGH